MCVHPDAELPGSLIEHKPSEVGDQTVLLGNADKHFRHQQTAVRVTPADQRFKPGKFLIFQTGNRLIENFHFVALDRASQLGFQVDQFRPLIPH